MVKKIATYLFATDEGTALWMEYANEVLKICEDAGMLPPKWENPSAKKLSIFEAEHSGIPLQFNTWEPE